MSINSLLFKAYPIARPLLFALDAEKAHNLTLKALKCAMQCRLTSRLFSTNLSLPTNLMGLKLKNPVGLAAGLDKNGAYIDALGGLGFGFLEVGTVTPMAQVGNDKPRMFRIPAKNAIINRMGFNNEGIHAFVANVQASSWRTNGGVLGLNIGKNAATPNHEAVNDYLAGMRAVYTHADYITINISSPNTKNLRELQSDNALDDLLKALVQEREVLSELHGRKVPLVVKVAPDLTADQVKNMSEVLSRNAIDGLIATNTTLEREAVHGLANSTEAGGLSGPPVHALSLQVINTFREELGPNFAIIGVGGIENGQQAIEKVQAGANAIQLYTGLIYKGPLLVQECVQALEGTL